MMYQAADLPEIDEVDVIVLKDWNWNRKDREYLSGAAQVRLNGGAASEVARAFRALPEGKHARCHYPAYGLRFFAGGRLVRSVSLCWQCNNAYATAEDNDERFVLSFDGADGQSQFLLQLCDRAVEGLK